MSRSSVAATEFHHIKNEWINTMKNVGKQYPLISAIFTVVAGIFGFFSFFHFTVSAVISSVLLLTLATSMGIAITGDGVYWKNLGNSVWDLGKFITGSNK